VVSGLVDFNDISYDDHADLLYDLAAQTVRHFQTYLSEKTRARCCAVISGTSAALSTQQMQDHYWEDVVGYEVKVSKGFTELKQSAYTYSVQEPPTGLSSSASGPRATWQSTCLEAFRHCLYPVQKFDSDAERRLAVILEARLQ